MRKLMYLFLIGAFSAPLQSLWAQDKPQEKPKSEEHAKTPLPVKVQVVFTEFDGDKKISSMPYAFTMLTDEKSGVFGTNFRTGIRIPIEIDSNGQKTTYIDVGSNIDCGVKVEEDGRFLVHIIFDRSALYPNKSPEGERLVAEPNGQPLIRQFRTNENLLLRDGQTSEIVMSTDPLNGHTMRVSVTVNAQK